MKNAVDNFDSMRFILGPKEMEEREAHNIFYFIAEKKKALRFTGRTRKQVQGLEEKDC